MKHFFFYSVLETHNTLLHTHLHKQFMNTFGCQLTAYGLRENDRPAVGGALLSVWDERVSTIPIPSGCCGGGGGCGDDGGDGWGPVRGPGGGCGGVDGSREQILPRNRLQVLGMRGCAKWMSG